MARGKMAAYEGRKALGVGPFIDRDVWRTTRADGRDELVSHVAA